MFPQQRQLLGHGGVAVLVAVDGVAEERQGAELVDVRAETGMDHQRGASAVARPGAM